MFDCSESFLDKFHYFFTYYCLDKCMNLIQVTNASTCIKFLSESFKLFGLFFVNSKKHFIEFCMIWVKEWLMNHPMAYEKTLYPVRNIQKIEPLVGSNIAT